MSGLLRSYIGVAPFLRPPNWRWTVAVKCLIDPTVTAEHELRLARRAGDEMLVEACQFYRQREDLMYHNPEYIAKYPAMYEAFQLFCHGRQSGGYRWLLEAMMMTDASNEEIAHEFCPLHGAETVARFRHVFFDIESYQKRPANIFCSILANSLEKTHHNTACDFSWKLLAYDQGFDAFREFITFQAGGSLPKPMVEWMRSVASCRRVFADFHLTASLRQMFRQESLAVMEHADRHWNNIVSKSVGDKMSHEDFIMETGEGILMMCQDAILDPSLEATSKAARSYYESGVSPTFQPDADLQNRVLGSTQS